MRLQHWEAALARHIQEAHGATFRWGDNDCALWCAKWVKTATGKDLLCPWSGLYRSARQARSLMRKRGYAAPEDIADAALSSVPICYASRGDIVLHPQGPLGICNGRRSFFLTEHGVCGLDTLLCERAWAVA